MISDCTASGTCIATGIGISTEYGWQMTSRSLPSLWLAVCRHVGLPPDSSIDRVLAAYGEAVGRGTIQRIRDGDQPRLASLQKLADAIGLSDVRALLEDPATSVSGVAQVLSYQPHEHPPLIEWRTIVEAKTDLPLRFRCEVPDGALWSPTEGGTAEGTPVVFACTDAHPAPGVGILVEDSKGRRYVRIYRQGAAGQWLAAARNANYLSLESERDGLKLLAVAENRLLDGQL